MAIWQAFPSKSIDVFGGLVTNIERMDLPENVSPNCQDVEFFIGGVRSRRGVTQIFSGGGGITTSMIRGWQPGTMGPFTACYFSSLTPTALTAGQLYFVDINGSNYISTYSGLCTYGMGGASFSGRQWMTFWDAIGDDFESGATPPRVFDSNQSNLLYRVGAQRPFWADSVASEVASTGNTMTAGTHLFRVTFEFADGSTSPISGPLSLVSTGGVNTAAQIASIPLGPPGTVRRVIWAATVTDSAIAGTQAYYTLRASSMIIPDNTTTTQIFAFTDNVLTAGESAVADSLFTLMPVPPAKGCVFYKNRAFWYHLTGAVQPGYQNALSWWDGLEFSEDANGALPLRGWLSHDAQVSLQTSTNGMPKVLRLTSNGAATCAILASRALTEAQQFTVPALQAGKKYGIAFRARQGTGTPFVQGNLRFTSNITGYSFNYDLPLSSLNAGWDNYSTGALIANFDYTVANKCPAFTVELVGTPTNNGYAEIEQMQVYDVSNQFQGSLVLASKPYTPGTCDGVTGLMLIQRDNGEQVNCGFVLRDNLYFAKNKSLYVTADNGVTEPGGWTVQQVSNTVGTMSEKGCAVGDNFAVIASADGLYYFDGGAPQKISQEIQPTWDRIPYQRMHLVQVAVNPLTKQIIVDCPLDSDTTAQRQIVLDYLEGFGDPIANGGHGRKWTIWNIPAASVCMADGGFDGKQRIFFGGSSATGTVAWQDPAAHNDPSAVITSFYETAPVGVPTGVSLFGGVIFWAAGAGALNLSYTIPVGTNTAIGTYTMADPAPRNWQAALNLQGEELGFRFGTGSSTDYFSVNKFAVFFKEHPFFNIRGLNP